MKRKISIVLSAVAIFILLFIGTACTQTDHGQYVTQTPEFDYGNIENDDGDINETDENLTEDEDSTENTPPSEEVDEPAIEEPADTPNVEEPVITPTPKPETPVESNKDILIKALTNGLNIRSGPGSWYSSVGKIDSGDCVAYMGKSGDWYITVYKNKTAYISASKSYTSLLYFTKGNYKVENVINVGKQLLGFPYVYGTPRYLWDDGSINYNFRFGYFDCSSFTQYVFKMGANVTLATTTRGQYYNGTYTSELKRGDIILFTNSDRYYNTGLERIGHVGIYLGNNYIMHSSSDYAVIEPISSVRWSYYIVARRIV